MEKIRDPFRTHAGNYIGPTWSAYRKLGWDVQPGIHIDIDSYRGNMYDSRLGKKSNRTSLNIDKNNHGSSLFKAAEGEPCVTYKGRFFPDPAIGRMSFGTPSYPSPLDRIRAGNQDRKLNIGMSPLAVENASFEGNQSFPKVSKSKFSSALSRKLNLDNFKGGDLNEVSFSAGYSKSGHGRAKERLLDHSLLDRSFNSPGRETTQGSSKESSLNMSSGEISLGESWTYYNSITGGGDLTLSFPSTVRNPNKALCTINAKTSEILTANEMACELFGYQEDELIGKMLKDLVKLKPKEQATILESHLETSGEVVDLAGKVIDAVDKNGLILPVSMWVKKLDHSEPRCLVVMEPVERTVATVKFTSDGTILACDEKLAYIHGFTGPHQVQGTHIKDLIPALKLPEPGARLKKDVKKQRATGRTKDGASFPLSIALEVLYDDEDDTYINNNEDVEVYKGVIWVFANISGLITFLPDGTIHSINDNFSLMLFGYRSTEVVGKNISMLIPDFYEILDMVDDSLAHPSSCGNNSSINSLHSKDSGRNSSRSSSKGTSTTDSEDQGIGSSVVSSLAQMKIETQGEFNIGVPGITSTPNKPSVADAINKRLSCPSENMGLVTTDKPAISDIQVEMVNISPEVTSPTHSTISTSSTDTLLTAREINPAEVSVSSSNSQNINTSGECAETSNKELTVDNKVIPSLTVIAKGVDNKSGNESLVLPEDCVQKSDGCEGDDNKDNCVPTGSDKNLSFELLDVVKSKVEVEESDNNVAKVVKDNIVCSIDSSTGKYESNDIVNSRTDAEIATKNSEAKWVNKNDHIQERDCKLPDENCQQNSTPCRDDKLKIQKSDLLVSPNLSDIMNLDLTSDSPGLDSSAVNGGDELDNSTSDESSGLNTTDDLLTASVGLLKLDTSLKHEHITQETFGEDKKPIKRMADLLKNVPKDKSRTSRLKNERVERLINESEKENRPPSSSASSCNDVDQDFDDVDGSSHGVDESFIDMLDNVDESLLHKFSISQFLNSRCSSRSRYLDDSNGSFYGSNVSENKLDLSSPAVEVYYPNGLPSPPLNYKGRIESFSFCNGTNNFDEVDSPSLRSFEQHEKGLKYLTKSRNGSRSSDYSSNGTMTLPEGSFQGIVFQIKRVQLDDGNSVYCMWVSRDPEEPGECGRSYANLTLASSLNSTMDQSNCSLGEILSERAGSASKDFIDENGESSQSGPITHVETEEDRAINYGPYSKFYDTLHSIGKGAFGFVKLARKKKDNTQVVVKFIRRAKVFSDCWIQDDIYGRIPLEVSVLVKLDHPNIVRILDIFENAEFVQMVMEKHGSGMDLFEFIDRSPCMDEPLASYIFRQMVSAVSYLHNKNILHRDIKDENVIVNEQFQIKLIDFGAVAFMEQGKMFATFCGTLEYCSPEVLMGNKYHGPELEVWSLGVTLYTLVFGENPFFDVDETIKCELKPPFKVSSELRILICWLLHPDVKHRATISGLEKNCWVQQKVDITQYKWSEVLPNTEFHGNTASDNRPESPPVRETVLGEINHEGLDELKCNLLKQLGAEDKENVYGHKYV